MRRSYRMGGLALLAALAGCGDGQQKDTGGIVSNAKSVPVGGVSDPLIPDDPEMIAQADGPLLGAVRMAVKIHQRPDPRSPKIGYLRVGVTLHRARKPVAYDGCQGGFYQVLPRGYVCLDEGASIDLNHPLLRAELGRPHRHRPLPYSYAFVRAIAPRYYRLPTSKEQHQYEMSLDRHLRSYHRLADRWDAIAVGSNDVPLDEHGLSLGAPPERPPALSHSEKFGGDGSAQIPWFFDGGRKIPNVSSFKVPDYAVITNRIRRHAGVALIDAFEGDERRFALSTDLRLIPTSKLKPGRGSVFHGVELLQGWDLPVGFVRRGGAREYRRHRGRYKHLKKRYAYGTPLQLTGTSRRDGRVRYLETEDGVWMRQSDLAIAVAYAKLPRFAKGKSKWIDVSIQRQTLTLFEGKTPIYATMVSTGRDGLGDPRKTHSTPRGTFRVRDKHITDTMDSQVLGSEFELNDVPWVQYFKSGYAIHGAYWHTDFGRPRSHGCINLSPIDAYRVFGWTEPPVPPGWHGVVAGEANGEGTRVHIHP